MLTLLALCCAVLTTPTVAVVGDSVILTVTVADNAVPQTVSVDSVEITTGIGVFGGNLTKRVAKGASTTVRFAWAKTNWAPNQSHGQAITARLGRLAAGCAGGMCWSASATGPSWSYTLDAVAPAAPDAAAITVQSVGLN